MTIESPIRHATSRAFRKRLVIAVALVAGALLVTGGIAQTHKNSWMERPYFSTARLPR